MSLVFDLLSTSPAASAADCLIAGLFADGSMPQATAAIDAATDGLLQQRADAGDISGKPGRTAMLFDVPGLAAPRVLIVGLGDRDAFNGQCLQKAAMAAVKALHELPVAHAISCLADIDIPGHDPGWRIRTEALAVDHAAYRYDATLGKRKHAAKPTLTTWSLAGNAANEPALAQARAMAEGIRFARELGNMPPNICNPAWLASQAQAFADTERGVDIDILDRDAMDELGMNALLAVARGSANEPRLIVLRWHGTDADEAPYALVGKGVTYDAGGLNLKPATGLTQMKFDMCGAASVLGAFVAAVKLRLPVNLVCAVASVENMPDGNAYRPGDVITTLSGQTVEVLNTDAEGRLILCDTLTYVQRFKPRAIVDAATLTGACMVALGHAASGLMSKHDDLAGELLAAGEDTLDRAWRLPLWDEYQDALESAFGDFAHLGTRMAGAITAGCLLSRFTEGQRWAHLDTAGTAWDEGRKGLATGRPTALLAQWLIDRAATS